MLLVSGFSYRFFEFRGRGRDLLSKRTLRSKFCACRKNDHCDRWSSMHLASAIQSFFFLFFFDLRLVNFEPRFKFQRALRPKEEDRRGLDKLSRRGAATNGFSSFGSCLDPKNGKSLLLLCHCARFSNTQYMLLYRLANLHAGPSFIQSSWANRDFALVLRLINNGLNQCCDKMMIAFTIALRSKNIAVAFNYFHYELVYFLLLFFSF